MKTFRRACALLAIILFPFLSAQALDQVTISFLKKAPSANNNCSESDIMDLIEGDGAEWISSIECNGVSTLSSWPGIRLNGIEGAAEPASMKFTMKAGPQLKVSYIQFYCIDTDGNDYKMSVSLNDGATNLLTGSLAYKSSFGTTDYPTLRQRIEPGAVNELDRVRTVGNLDPLVELSNFEFQVGPLNKESNRVQILAIRIYYDGTTTNISSGLDLIQGKELNIPVEYYDLQGRRLNAIPADGIYLRKTGSKIEKLIAR